MREEKVNNEKMEEIYLILKKYIDAFIMLKNVKKIGLTTEEANILLSKLLKYINDLKEIDEEFKNGLMNSIHYFFLLSHTVFKEDEKKEVV